MYMNDIKEYGFALGGGGAKAFSQLGAIKALEKHGIKPAYFAGSSMGAVNAIFLSAGYSIEELISFYSNHHRHDFFKLGFFRFTNIGLAKIVLSLCQKKGFQNLEDLPRKVYVSTTLPDYGLRITLRKGRIDQVVMASTAAHGIKRYLVKDIAIKRQIIQQSQGLIGNQRILYLVDSCYSSNVPFELLQFIRKDYPELSSSYFDIAFDVVPSYSQTGLIALDMFNKRVLSNDTNRVAFFNSKERGLYLKLDAGIKQTSFNNKSLELGVSYGEKYVEDLLKKKNALN